MTKQTELTPTQLKAFNALRAKAKRNLRYVPTPAEQELVMLVAQVCDNREPRHTISATELARGTLDRLGC